MTSHDPPKWVIYVGVASMDDLLTAIEAGQSPTLDGPYDSKEAAVRQAVTRGGPMLVVELEKP